MISILEQFANIVKALSTYKRGALMQLIVLKLFHRFCSATFADGYKTDGI